MYVCVVGRRVRSRVTRSFKNTHITTPFRLSCLYSLLQAVDLLQFVLISVLILLGDTTPRQSCVAGGHQTLSIHSNVRLHILQYGPTYSSCKYPPSEYVPPLFIRSLCSPLIRDLDSVALESWRLAVEKEYTPQWEAKIRPLMPESNRQKHPQPLPTPT